MTDDLYRAALHEAGHAVLAELLCMNPVSVTIEPEGYTFGQLRRRGTGYTPIEKWRNLLVLSAGHLAEGLAPEGFDGDDPLDMLGADYENYLGDDEGSDSAQIWASLQEHSDDDEQMQEWFEHAFAQTRQILSDSYVWRSVESLATRLMEERTLDRYEASNVVMSALGDSEWSSDQFGNARRYAWPPHNWTDALERED